MSKRRRQQEMEKHRTKELKRFELEELPDLLLQLKNHPYVSHSLPEPPRAWGCKKRRSAAAGIVSPPEPPQPLVRVCMEEVKKISCPSSQQEPPSVSARIKMSEEKNVSSSTSPGNMNLISQYNCSMEVMSKIPSTSAAPATDYMNVSPRQPSVGVCLERVKKVSCPSSKKNSTSPPDDNDGVMVKTESCTKLDEKNIPSPSPENLNFISEYNPDKEVMTEKPSSSAVPVTLSPSSLPDFIIQLTKLQKRSLKKMSKEDLMETKWQLLVGNVILKQELNKVYSFLLKLKGLQERFAQTKQNALAETSADGDNSRKQRVPTELRVSLSPTL